MLRIRSVQCQYWSGSSIFGKCGSGSSCGSRFRWRKIYKNHSFFFLIKNCSLLIPFGRSSYTRSLQSSKENIQHLKHEISSFFSVFKGHFCPPGSGSESAFSMRIRVQPTKINADPDPQRCWKDRYIWRSKPLHIIFSVPHQHSEKYIIEIQAHSDDFSKCTQ